MHDPGILHPFYDYYTLPVPTHFIHTSHSLYFLGARLKILQILKKALTKLMIIHLYIYVGGYVHKYLLWLLCNIPFMTIFQRTINKIIRARYNF